MENRSAPMLRSGAVGEIERAMPWALAERPAREIGRPRLAWATTPQERAALMRATVAAQSALQEAVVAATEAAQRALSLTVMLEQSLEQAPGVVAAQHARPAGPPPRAVEARDLTRSLSPREREVLAMVADGCSNKAIAEALYVSPNTIKTHVASLLHKLHADSRAQLAAIVARQWCGRTVNEGHGL